MCKRLVFSGASTAKQLQQFVESNIYHRQGMLINLAASSFPQKWVVFKNVMPKSTEHEMYPAYKCYNANS